MCVFKKPVAADWFLKQNWVFMKLRDKRCTCQLKCWSIMILLSDIFWAFKNCDTAWKCACSYTSQCNLGTHQNCCVWKHENSKLHNLNFFPQKINDIQVEFFGKEVIVCVGVGVGDIGGTVTVLHCLAFSSRCNTQDMFRG